MPGGFLAVVGVAEMVDDVKWFGHRVRILKGFRYFLFFIREDPVDVVVEGFLVLRLT